MSWSDLRSAAPVELRPSPYDSARFSLDVERATVGLEAESSSAAVCEAIDASRADVVILRYPAAEVGWFAALASGSRRAILADSLVYWSLPTGKGRRPRTSPELSAAEEPAGPGLEDLVGRIFGGYANHYLANPLFDPQLALAGYQEWAVRSVEAQPAVYLRLDGEAVGVATLDDQGEELEIELAGVVPGHQGRGLYAHLLTGVEDVAAARGSAAVVISTQGHNTNVQRAWARYGFEPVATFLTVHLVADRATRG